MEETQANRSFWRALLANQTIFFLSAIVGIASFPLSIYFYYEGRQSPDLTFSTNPVKLEIVSARQTTKLSVSYEGRAVNNDITTTQVAIWNQGKTPIRRSDILKLIVIYTEPETPVLEATLRKTSRDFINFGVRVDELQRGRIPVSWDVLERGDGGMIEVIYAGSPEVKFNVEGAVVGQTEVTRYENKIGFQSPDEEFETLRTSNKGRRLFFLPFAAAMGIGFIFTVLQLFKPESRNKPGGRKTLAVLAVLLLTMTGLSVTIFILSRYPSPPPGL